MKKYTYIASLLILTSCGITKDKQSTDNTITTTDVERRTITREPSKVVNETKYNVKYKDTTITTTNYKTKTVLREVYDDKGNRSTECICDGIKEDIELIKTRQENDIKESKSTTHDFNPQHFIWALAGLGVVILLIGGLFLYVFTKAQTATQNTLIEIAKGIIK